jgi:hypothetical protein
MLSGMAQYQRSRRISSRKSMIRCSLILYWADGRHAHSDHYTNLSKAWNYGPIYCSITTGNLIVHMLGVEPKWVVSPCDVRAIPCIISGKETHQTAWPSRQHTFRDAQHRWGQGHSHRGEPLSWILNLPLRRKADCQCRGFSYQVSVCGE